MPSSKTDKTTGGDSNEQQIYDYLTHTLGFSAAGAAAALGNFEVESDFNTSAYNANEGAIGLAQWELGRRTALDSYAASKGLKETDLSAQLGYLGRELTRSFSGVLSAMRTATDPADAAAIWDAQFERSSGDARTQRESNARGIYAQIQSGKALTGGGWASADAPIVGGSLTSIAGDIGSDIGGTATSVWDALTGWEKTLLSWAIKLTFVGSGLVLLLLGANATVKSSGAMQSVMPPAGGGAASAGGAPAAPPVPIVPA